MKKRVIATLQGADGKYVTAILKISSTEQIREYLDRMGMRDYKVIDASVELTVII